MQTYRYDTFGRLVRVGDSLPADNISMVTEYTYDSYGKLNTRKYHSGLTLTNVYDVSNSGYLYKIKNGADTLWQLHSSNNRGQPVRYYLGSQVEDLQVNFSYDAYGKVSEITTGQMKQTCSFDPASGNLTSRDWESQSP